MRKRSSIFSRLLLILWFPLRSRAPSIKHVSVKLTKYPTIKNLNENHVRVKCYLNIVSLILKLERFNRNLLSKIKLSLRWHKSAIRIVAFGDGARLNRGVQNCIWQRKSRVGATKFRFYLVTLEKEAFDIRADCSWHLYRFLIFNLSLSCFTHDILVLTSVQGNDLRARKSRCTLVRACQWANLINQVYLTEPTLPGLSRERGSPNTR